MHPASYPYFLGHIAGIQVFDINEFSIEFHSTAATNCAQRSIFSVRIIFGLIASFDLKIIQDWTSALIKIINTIVLKL